ncbi:MAG TPA: SDR family NAD(P)-dependent oxidoreductase [Candidatus Cybelea sp.]|jgi:short-subunit dehydrogenase|nr:SDR family NAD(P)-dependent oxidoreductase [Candidatus Cybelea sp.]
MIVTGASSGIGRALALTAARDGYRVVVTARREARLQEVTAAIAAAGGSSIAVAGDITAREMPARVVESTVRAFGRIDVVVNNAGAGAYGFLLEQSDATLAASWELHVAAPLRLSRAALSYLQTTRGQLVFVGSGVARVPLAQQGAYAAAKAAIRAAAIQLRRELRSRGVGVTYVDPGVVATEFHSRLGVSRPPGRIAEADRVARAILRGIARRRAVINAVPWQTAFATLGEWSGTLADPVVIGRFTTPRIAEPSDPVIAPENAPSVILSERSESKDEGGVSPTTFDAALEPVARRMERVKLSPNFLREALVPDSTLELNALAMRWAGMPNKNERAALREALEALELGGYLKSAGEETWRVVRAAD